MVNPFRRVNPTMDQSATMAGLATKCASLHADISACLPDSPYKTEALMYVEKAAMMANKGITHATT